MKREKHKRDNKSNKNWTRVQSTLSIICIKLPFKFWTYTLEPVDQKILTNAVVVVVSEITECSIPVIQPFHINIIQYEKVYKKREKCQWGHTSTQ